MRQTAWFALWVVLLDQFSKWLILGSMRYGESIELVGDLVRVTYLRNDAGVMGIDLVSGVGLLLLSLPALALLIWFWYSSRDQHPAYDWLLAGICGGAVGNIIDRAWHGWVVDFIDINIPDLHLPSFQLLGWSFNGFHLERWWVFNVADSFIFVGIILLFCYSFIANRATRHESDHISKN
jgi:signal peptidase II